MLTVASASGIQLVGATRSLVATLAGTLLIVGLLWVLTRSTVRASLMASAVLIALASPDLLNGLAAMMGILFPVGWALVAAGVVAYLALAIAAVAALRGLRRGTLNLAALHRRANLLGAVLLGTVVATSLVAQVRAAPADDWRPRLGDACANVTHQAPASPVPDIYQILLDGYPRADVLAERFGFDNAPFVDALRSDGFVVDEASHSNYTYTALSFSSMFNLRYLQEVPSLATVVGRPVEGRREALDAISGGTIFAVLRQAGYRILTTAVGWEHVTTRAAADEYLDHGQITDLERNLIERTWLPELISWFAGDWFADDQRARVLDVISDVESAARRPDDGPLFVFAHVPVPHYPIVFGADGVPLAMGSLRDISRQVADLGMTEAQYGPGYVAQLAYGNRLVLDAIAAIDASTRQRPAIVIVMSDHGYTHDWRRVDPHDRFSNLFAARTPGNAHLFDGGTTPVNLYRKLLNEYLGGCEEMLPDRFFLSPTIDERMDVVPVPDPDSHADPGGTD